MTHKINSVFWLILAHRYLSCHTLPQRYPQDSPGTKPERISDAATTKHSCDQAQQPPNRLSITSTQVSPPPRKAPHHRGGKTRKSRYFLTRSQRAGVTLLDRYTLLHGVGRVLSFSPVVGIGTPPTPHPLAPPPLVSGGGAHSLAREGVGEWGERGSGREVWGLPQPLTRWPPPFGFRGRGTLAGERGGGRVPIPTRGTYTVVLFIYTYFVPCLVKAYHQIPIAEEDIPKIVIATPFGKKKHRSGPPASPYGP
jgi:hypothetical protein